MRYTGGLSKKEREQIFRLFIDKRSLRFNQIEKALKIRSNLVAYHLDRMRKEMLLEKDGENYSLTPKAEKLLPILPHITGLDTGPLPAVLAAVLKRGKILLLQRNKRPYQGYWGLVGGRMRHEESIEQAAIRLVKEKSGIIGTEAKVNAIMQEQVRGDSVIKHSFILFFTTVTAEGGELRDTGYGPVEWSNLRGLEKKEVIPSDLWLIKNKLGKKCLITQARMEESEGLLHGFEIIKKK